MSPDVNPFDVRANLEALESSLGEVAALTDLDPETFLARTEVSGWSAAEHAFHLILACDLSFRNARSLALDKGRLVREPEDRNDEALAILAEGVIPRGEAEAPRFVQPPPRIDLELLATLTAEVREARTALAQDLAAVEAAPRAVPHQVLGDLTAPEWVRFARIHTAHHLTILREVLAG